MYLVELRPGKEELYRTADELAAAIRRGDVDAHSRIYHRATSKWISVTLHPQFKAISAQRPPEPPLPPLERTTWTYLNAQSETLEAREEPGVPDSGSGLAPSGARATPWRRLFGLGLAGVALVFAVELTSSAPKPPWAASTSDGDASARPASAPAAAEEKPQTVSLASTSGAWRPGEIVYDPVSAKPAADSAPVPARLPRAPRLRPKAMGAAIAAATPSDASAEANSVAGLLARYAGAYDSAAGRLASGFRVARLDRLFASSRLTPDGGVTDTRLGLAGVANFIRVYRQQESAIEREYQDSFTALSREHGWSSREVRRWYSRTSPKEPAKLVDLTAQLLASLDSLLGVLNEEAGAYRLGDGTISFEDIEASRRYLALQGEITALVDSARAAGGEQSRGPMGHLLQAIGATRLPRVI